ncbi:TIM barrel protein [Senegalia massiliensis]|uniref:TIM barrel protein n=1 Tax=Senegalia massiliensis TaxID=1720316 RepID=UPI001F5F0A02|nr:TIM barrel protein [Senegalia massiliensis]
MQIGCLARYFNPYKEEVKFAEDNNFPTIIHAVLDINEFREHVPKLVRILKYLGHDDLIIHPICESETIDRNTIYKLSDEMTFALEKLEKENITLYLENNSRLDRVFNTTNEIEIIFKQNPKLEFILDIAHIDDYEHLESMIEIKIPKILHVADRRMKLVHEHLPIGQGNIDYSYIFTNILNEFDGKIILEIVQSSEDIINSKVKIEEYFNL